jgi:hypothetical protein
MNLKRKILPPKTPCRESRCNSPRKSQRSQITTILQRTRSESLTQTRSFAKEARDKRETKTLKIRTRGRWRGIPQLSHWGTSTCRKAEYLLRTSMALGKHGLGVASLIFAPGNSKFSSCYIFGCSVHNFMLTFTMLDFPFSYVHYCHWTNGN